jgi:hypothetical protein
MCRDMRERESTSSAYLHHQEEVHALDVPVTCSIGPPSINYLAGCMWEGARLRVWWGGIRHVAVEPLDVARSKDLTNTPNWCILVYFWVYFPWTWGFACGCSCCRGAVSHVVWGSAASATPCPRLSWNRGPGQAGPCLGRGDFAVSSGRLLVQNLLKRAPRAAC